MKDMMMMLALALHDMAERKELDARMQRRCNVTAEVLKALITNEPMPFGLKAAPEANDEETAMTFLKSLGITAVRPLLP